MESVIRRLRFRSVVQCVNRFLTRKSIFLVCSMSWSNRPVWGHSESSLHRQVAFCMEKSRHPPLKISPNGQYRPTVSANGWGNSIWNSTREKEGLRVWLFGTRMSMGHDKTHTVRRESSRFSARQCLRARSLQLMETAGMFEITFMALMSLQRM